MKIDNCKVGALFMIIQTYVTEKQKNLQIGYQVLHQFSDKQTDRQRWKIGKAIL